MALGVPGRLRPRIFSTFGTTRVAGRQPNAQAAFTTGEIPGTHFQRTTEKIPGDITGDRSRDRPTSSAAPYPLRYRPPQLAVLRDRSSDAGCIQQAKFFYFLIHPSSNIAADTHTKITFHWYTNSLYLVFSQGARGGVEVKALCYKTACRGFDSQWSHWNFSVT